MQAILRLSYCLLAIPLLSACSGPPLRVPPPQQVRKQPPDAANTQPDVDAAMRKRGYKPALYRGERVYCRNETITGSNLETKVCLTARQIEDQERSGKDMLTGPHPDGCGPETRGCM
jgi:hypothetical protein